jgi:hypothetical protein
VGVRGARPRAGELTALRAVDRARADGLRIAVDNVGLAPASFVLLPLLRPDLVKLDRSLVTDMHAAERLIDGLGDYFRHSGVHVVVQGVEVEEHLALAVAMGARYGQGYLFGRPLPLPKGDGEPTWESSPGTGALAILTTDGATLLTAQPATDGAEGQYRYTQTRDRETVVGVCRSLLRQCSAELPAG